jgi:hypothetical protein
MYVVVHHQVKDPDAATARVEKLIRGEGVPPNTRNLRCTRLAIFRSSRACGSQTRFRRFRTMSIRRSVTQREHGV